MSTKFGIATPSTLWDATLTDKQAMLSAISNAGFDHVFLADHVSFRNGSGTDGFVEVAALSQLHADLGVMISIYLLPLRHPLPVARQLATMAKLAPGRMTFGIGVGGEDRHEIEVCGIDPRTRGKLTNESLQIIRSLLEGQEVTFTGDHFQVEQAKIRPTPRQQIPIIVGGRSNAALERAARYGEGWIGVWCSSRRFAEATQLINDIAKENGRADVDWQHGYQPWVGVGKTREQARAVVKEQMQDFYKVPFEKFEKYTPYGTPEQVAEQLSEYHDAGCRLFNLKICTENPADEIEAGAEVRSQLNAKIKG